MNENKNLTVEENYVLAVENQQKNEHQAAIKLYNEILKINPNHINTRVNLGSIFINIGEFHKAINCLEKGIRIDPDNSYLNNNLGVVFNNLGEHQQAINFLKIAIRIDPDNVDANCNIGVAFKELGYYQKAISHYRKAIDLNPNFVRALNNLANVHKDLGEHQQAKDCYEKAIEINPNFVEAINNLGVLFHDTGEYQKAMNCYEKVIKINPQYTQTHNNLGVMFKDMKKYQKAIDIFQQGLQLVPNDFNMQTNIASIYIAELNDFEKAIDASNNALKIHHKNSKFVNQSVSLFRLKHDVQQAKYISQTGGFWNFFKSKNYKINGIDEFIKVGDEILKRKENNEKENNSNKIISLNPNEINSLLPYFKENTIYKTKTISGSCINPNKNWLEVEDEYLNSSNQIMYIDDFLSDEALIELREFCLVSKVWNREYPNKYLGAFSDSGFISPIHLQIAIDLQKKLPKLFGPHRLGKFWGFKYDANLGKGINIHADFAIHNLNFWITPDEYNNNKKSGGLKVYDAPAPDNWTFKKYNGRKDKIYEFLKENNANCTNVPYKFNRAVLFNSAYFHETDEIDFKDEYVGRRINNTYLFGARVVK